MGRALRALRSAKLVKTRVMGQCQTPAPSEGRMSSLPSRNVGCGKVNLLLCSTSISLSDPDFMGSPVIIPAA